MSTRRKTGRKTGTCSGFLFIFPKDKKVQLLNIEHSLIASTRSHVLRIARVQQPIVTWSLQSTTDGQRKKSRLASWCRHCIKNFQKRPDIFWKFLVMKWQYRPVLSAQFTYYVDIK